MSAGVVFFDTASNFHPYECDGPGKCVHCDRRVVVYTADEGTSSFEHDPVTCALCDDGLSVRSAEKP
jgi:hypothetical protein